MNVTDEDGDTPLYVVENVETARFLVEHGAVVARQNHEGQTVRVSATCRTLGPQMPAPDTNTDTRSHNSPPCRTFIPFPLHSAPSIAGRISRRRVS